MVAFSLPQLPALLLERIITKLESKSYFRVQQTCRGMEELIRTSKNIRVCMDKEIIFSQEHLSEMFPSKFYINGHNVHAENLRGIRFSDFTPLSCLVEKLDQFCDILKEYRITSSDLFIDDCQRFTKDHIAALFAALKPIGALLVNTSSDQLEALPTLNGMRKLVLSVDPKDVMASLGHLSQFPMEVDLMADASNPLLHRGDPNELLAQVIETLRTTRLHRLDFFFKRLEHLDDVENVLDRWSAYDPIILRGYGEEYKFYCNLPHTERGFQLTLSFCSAKISYNPSNDDY